MNSLANCLLASIRAALRLGPKHGIFISRSASAKPLASGTSGPMITKSILFSKQYLMTLSLLLQSREGIFCVFGCKEIPALPGATKICPT